MLRLRVILFAIVCACLFRANNSAAQCEGLVPGHAWPGIGGGSFNIAVRAMTDWDPDGSGPEPSLLVMGGPFLTGGGASSPLVTTWNGSEWKSLGLGAPNSQNSVGVKALTVWNGDLIAAGSFLLPDSFRGIARRSGGTWYPLGTGTTGTINAICVFNGDLIAGGSFTSIGGLATNHVARWNGTTWLPMGSGLTGEVRTLIVHNGELIAAGTSVFHRWTGSAWTAFSSTNGTVYALCPFNGGLVAAGSFTGIGSTSASSIAFWNGSVWQPMSSWPGTVYSVAATSSGLFAGGVTPSSPINNVARWTGSTWQAMGPPGSTGVRWDSGDAPWVTSLREYRGRLHVGGYFELAGDLGVLGVASWDGSSWGALGGGISDPVLGLTRWNRDLIACGEFYSAGGVVAKRIARWDGAKWHALGAFPSTGRITSAIPYHKGLLVGGTFSFTSNPATWNVARWDGSSWLSIGGIQGTTGSTDVGPILDDNQGSVYFAGNFSTAGGVNANRIARWDGQSWFALGAGVDGPIACMVWYHNELIVGGSFTTAGGLDAPNLARWNGQSWVPFADGVNNGVSSLLVRNGQLLVGGTFTRAGQHDVTGFAAWDGTTWQYPIAPDSFPAALLEVEGDLVACGRFNNDTRLFARWTGQAWQYSGDGLTAFAGRKCEAMNGEVVIGGYFESLNGAEGGSIGRWSFTGRPWIALHPTAPPASPCIGSTVALSVTPASGYAALTYQWRRNGLPLSDGPTAAGSIISGAGTPSLSISGLASADAGAYDVRVSNSCGEVLSDAATLSLCYPNCDCSGIAPVLTANDFQCFLNRFAAKSPYANCDGSTTPPTLTANDFQCFLNAYAAGCQ